MSDNDTSRAAQQPPRNKIRTTTAVPLADQHDVLLAQGRIRRRLSATHHKGNASEGIRYRIMQLQ